MGISWIFPQPSLQRVDRCGCACQIVVCPEVLPPKMVPPGVVQESLSHQLLSVDPQSEQEPQKPHLLEENGEDV